MRQIRCLWIRPAKARRRGIPPDSERRISFSRWMYEVPDAAGLTDETYQKKGEQIHGNCV